MDLQLIVFSIFISALFYYVFDWATKDRVTRMLDKLPGPVAVPLIGTTYRFMFVPEEERMNNVKRKLRGYGPIIRTWLGRTPVVHLLSPEYIEPVLNNSTQITKSTIYDTIRPWLGDGLLTSTGRKWHTHRKLITPTFHFAILDNFMEIFVEKAKLLVSQLESKIGEDVTDLYPYITRCTLDIISETAMGVEINAMLNPNNEYVKSVYNITKGSVERLTRPWLYSDFIFYKTNQGKQFKHYLNTLHSFTANVIKERKSQLNERKLNLNSAEDVLLGKKVKRTFLDLLLEMSSNFTDTDLREEVDTFMFEGHDTTTAGICWSLFLLGNHPKIQDAVFEEVKTVFHESNGNLTINDLNKLKLLERCIKEALRLYPSVPTIGRQLTEDLQLGKYVIPAGASVNIQIFLLHLDENIYPDPEKFDPDRFLPENIKGRHPFAYIPFSAGPRNCIGQKFAMYEEKTLLAYILNKYKVIAVENQETVRSMMELILRPHKGLLVKLEPR